MAKQHNIVVSDVTLESFHLTQRQNPDTELWEVMVSFRGVVIDDSGNPVPQMRGLTASSTKIATGLSSPATKQQIVANKDVIFAAFTDWIDDVRENIAGITT